MRILLTACSIILVASCIDKTQIAIPQSKTTLIIEAFLEDPDDTARVTISESYPIDGQLLDRKFVAGAIVTIVENGQSTYRLKEGLRGKYLSPIDAKIGNSYQLFIELDGINMVSSVQTIEDPGELESISFDLSTIEQQNSSETIKNMVNFYASSSASLEASKRIRWEWVGTYKVRTEPRLLESPPTPANPFGTPAPECAGNNFTRCTCCECWITEKEKNLILSDARFARDGKIKKIFLGSTEVNGRTFLEKYHIRVQQTVLSSEAYLFYENIRNQSQGATSLFQPPFFGLTGNVSTTNSDQQIIGVFSCTAARSLSMYVYPSDLPFPIAYEIIPADCRRLDPSSTNRRPLFW